MLDLTHVGVLNVVKSRLSLQKTYSNVQNILKAVLNRSKVIDNSESPH